MAVAIISEFTEGDPKRLREKGNGFQADSRQTPTFKRLMEIKDYVIRTKKFNIAFPVASYKVVGSAASAARGLTRRGYGRAKDSDMKAPDAPEGYRWVGLCAPSENSDGTFVLWAMLEKA